MSRYSQKPDDQREPPQPAVSRRVMLIASGGLMLGIAGVAGVVGCASERLPPGAPCPAPPRGPRGGLAPPGGGGGRAPGAGAGPSPGPRAAPPAINSPNQL